MKLVDKPITVRMEQNKTSKVYLEDLKKIYKDSVNAEYLFSEPETDEDLELLFASKLWRLNNLYTIVNKDGSRTTFKMNIMQHRLYAAKLAWPRIILLKSRQIGGSTFACLDYLDDALTLDDLSIGLMAQGKEEATTLLSRVKLAWEEFPDWAREFLMVGLATNNKTEFEFTNGSKIFIRTSFRSATLQRLWISEFAKISVKTPAKALETKTGTMQAIKIGNPILIESTAEKGGIYETMWNEAYYRSSPPSGKDYAPMFIGWTEDPTCTLNKRQPITGKMADYFEDIELQLNIKLTKEQKWFYVSQHRELGEYTTQEYPSTPEEAFMAAKDGSYYAKLYRKHVIAGGRIQPDLYDPSLDVFISMDLGINDDCPLKFFQRDYKGNWSIIDEYASSGEGLAHYVGIITERCNKYGYKIACLYMPHDAKQREKGSGKSLLSIMRKLVGRKYPVRVLGRTSVSLGIEAVRQMIKKLWLDEKCVDTQDELVNYSREWDERRGVWKDKPKHDKFSHGADAIRCMAMSEKLSTDTNIRKKSSRLRSYRGIRV